MNTNKTMGGREGWVIHFVTWGCRVQILEKWSKIKNDLVLEKEKQEEQEKQQQQQTQTQTQTTKQEVFLRRISSSTSPNPKEFVISRYQPQDTAYRPELQYHLF